LSLAPFRHRSTKYGNICVTHFPPLRKSTSTYAELREVWRQKGGPLAFLASNPTATNEEERLGLVARTGEAIRAGVERFVHELDAHGLLEACDARDDVVMAAAEWYVRDPAGALLGCKDRETVKHERPDPGGPGL
jgi:hypothetical protein